MGTAKRFLFVFLKAAPCSCRCRHCDFAVSGTYPVLPIERVSEYLDPFVRARDAGTIPFANLAAFLGDSPLSYPNLADGVAYLRRNRVEGWYSLAVDGFRFRSPDTWRPYLESLREAGTEYLEFTLYGAEETHDWFARRPGDFAAIAQMAHLWQRELAGKTLWCAFVHKRNLSELDDLAASIADDFGARLHARLWGYLGFAATRPAENLRLEASDLDGLTDDLRSQLDGVRPEREWVAELCDSDDSPHPELPQVVHLTVDREGAISLPYRPAIRTGHRGTLRVGQFPIESAESLLVDCDRAYQTWRARYPDLGVLGQRHGDPSGTRLYDYQSIRDKWCDRHDSRPSP